VKQLQQKNTKECIHARTHNTPISNFLSRFLSISHFRAWISFHPYT